MVIGPGTRFGPYEVAGPLGRGGMGEVYRAVDTRLKRDVALKVLPQAFVADVDRLARFRREAEILASLNHPNIAQIYGLEEAGGQTAIVMELVEGPTLAARIASGPLPPDEAMAIATQILAALEAAHARQIVHRDLKPDNIKLGEDGTVKVLDFGIAKPIDPTTISGGTLVGDTPAVTQTGVILGTAAYMAPEQARGKFVDARADVWSFGCLLFEMLTGQPAFGGEDVMLTLARVLDRDTDLSSIPATLSPAVRHTIKLCLQKDPRRRIADIRDVRLALEGGFESELPRAAGVAAQPRLAARLVAPALALVAGAAIAAVIASGRSPELASRPITRFTIPVPAGLALQPNTTTPFDLSRDGRRLLINTVDGLYVRELDSLEAARVQGINGAIAIAAFNGDEISFTRFRRREEPIVSERISIYGGPASVVFDEAVLARELNGRRLAQDVTGTTSSGRGTTLLARRGGIAELGIDGGGSLTPLVKLGEDSWPFRPRLLADGDAIIFSLVESSTFPSSAQLADARLVVVSLPADQDTPVEPTPLPLRGLDPRYVAETGHLLFLRDGVVYAVAFDPVALVTRGEPRAVLPGVQLTGDAAEYRVAENGTLAYLPAAGGAASVQARLGWLTADGRFDALPFAPPWGAPGNLRFPALSPDGTKLAAAAFDGSTSADLYVYDLQRPGTRVLLAGAEEVEPRAVWMPDGESLIFYRAGGGLFRRAADGSDRETLILAQPAGFQAMIPDWIHPDGTELVFTHVGPDQRRGLYRLKLTEGAAPESLLDEPGFSEGGSALSPDGRYIAYATDESGKLEIHIRTYPDVTSRRYVVATDDSLNPEWDADGGYLYYVQLAAGNANEGSLMRVAISTEGGIEIGAPEVVSTDKIIAAPINFNYAYDSAADRWLVYSVPSLSGAGSSAGREIVLVQNWTEWLESQVPTR